MRIDYIRNLAIAVTTAVLEVGIVFIPAAVAIVGAVENGGAWGLVAGAIAFVGLCISSAVFFCLSEIADNTAEISKMLAEVTNRETQGSPALPKKG
jgi:hypothetical protein